MDTRMSKAEKLGQLCYFCYESFFIGNDREMDTDYPANIYSSCIKHISPKFLSPQFLKWRKSKSNKNPFCQKCSVHAQKLSLMNDELDLIQKRVESFVEIFTCDFLNRREKALSSREGILEENIGENIGDENTCEETTLNAGQFDENMWQIGQIKQEIESTEIFDDLKQDSPFSNLSHDHNSNLNDKNVDIPLSEMTDNEKSQAKFVKARRKHLNLGRTLSINLQRVEWNPNASIIPEQGTLTRKRVAVKSEDKFSKWVNNSDASFSISSEEEFDELESNNLNLLKHSEPERLATVWVDAAQENRSKAITKKTRNSIIFNNDANDNEGQNFKCEKCGKSFKSIDDLTNHEKIHENNRFKCDLCGMSYVYKRNLRYHLQRHISETPLENEKKILKMEENKLLGPYDKKDEHRPFECKECGKLCSSKGMLFYHNRNHKMAKLELKCEICNKIFKNPLTFQNHGKVHSGENKTPCPTCGKLFRSTSGLKEHKIQHNIDEKEKREKYFHCESCNSSFISSSRLKRHSLIHTDERPFGPCSLCGSRFRTSSSLKEHVRTHNGTDRHKFKCPICNKNYTTKSNLTQHMFRHNEEKHFECAVCGKKFATKDSLTTHSKYHNKSKDFLCDECGKKFWTKTKLNIHYRVHTGDLLPCQYCHKKFDTTTHLKQHYRSHTRKMKDARSISQISTDGPRTSITNSLPQ